jgi:ribosomal protein L1
MPKHPEHPDDEQLHRQVQRLVNRLDRLIPLVIKQNDLMELYVHATHGEPPKWARSKKRKSKAKKRKR